MNDDLDEKAEKAWDEFKNKSFVKFARENHPDLEVSKISSFGFTTGYKHGYQDKVKKLEDILSRFADVCTDIIIQGYNSDTTKKKIKDLHMEYLDILNKDEQDE